MPLGGSANWLRRPLDPSERNERAPPASRRAARLNHRVQCKVNSPSLSLGTRPAKIGAAKQGSSSFTL